MERASRSRQGTLVAKGFGSLWLVAVVLLLPFSLQFGCATQMVRHKQGMTLRPFNPDQPKLLAAKDEGLLEIGGVRYRHLILPDFVVDRPARPRQLHVVMPLDPLDGQAVFAEQGDRGEELDPLLRCLGPARFEAVKESHGPPASQEDRRAYIYVDYAEGALFADGPRALQQNNSIILSPQKFGEESPLLAIALPDYPEMGSLRTATLGAEDLQWHWSARYEVRDCLLRPTGKDAVARTLWYGAYILTVPFDVVTSPIQLYMYVTSFGSGWN